jgi:acyl dehydratase
MTILHFEEAEVGQLRTAGPYLVSRNEIIEFAQKYDPQSFHINEEAAARSVFAGLTASGAHTFAILISLLSKAQPYSLRVLAGLAGMNSGSRSRCVQETSFILKWPF